jgi:hypothetical protein
VFAVAKPFEDYLLLSVEDRVAPGRDEVVGRVFLPMTAIEKQSDEKPVTSRWFKSSMYVLDGFTKENRRNFFFFILLFGVGCLVLG